MRVAVLTVFSVMIYRDREQHRATTRKLKLRLELVLAVCHAHRPRCGGSSETPDGHLNAAGEFGSLLIKGVKTMHGLSTLPDRTSHYTLEHAANTLVFRRPPVIRM